MHMMTAHHSNECRNTIQAAAVVTPETSTNYALHKKNQFEVGGIFTIAFRPGIVNGVNGVKRQNGYLLVPTAAVNQSSQISHFFFSP